MKLTHKQKVKIAKKMGGFLSENWQVRKDAIAKRVQTKIKKIQKSIQVKKAKKNDK